MFRESAEEDKKTASQQTQTLKERVRRWGSMMWIVRSNAHGTDVLLRSSMVNRWRISKMKKIPRFVAH